MGNHDLLHPTERTLSDFSLGKLDDGRAEIINNHLNECPDCQRLLAEISSDSFLGRLRGAQGQSGGPNTGTRAPIMSEEPALDTRSAALPPDLAEHPDYQLVRELGRGGMGVVYLAHNRLMGRDEVLKVVGKHLIERKGVLERFSREIRSAARLMHPNIVHAYSAFRCGESIVFAMEYVDGLDLAKMVKAKGPMSVAHACYFVHQAALGLQHAHEQGMVHRDIKPGNLMLARKGDKSVVKVLDFGLAKATRESPLDGALTHEGQMLGTPDFIAPEQIRDAQSAGIQADIYSLGCTLYYLLTGAPPFQGPSLYDLLQAHFSMDAQPLNLVRPEVPAELAALVAKMMAKDLERRFQTPAEVAEALKPFFKKAGASSKPDVSTLGQPGPQPDNLRADPVPTAFVAGSQSQTPAGFNEPDRSGDALRAAPAPAPDRRPAWRSLPLMVAAGAFNFVMLGVIIVVITKNSRETIDTGKDHPTVTIDKTVGGSGGDAGDSRVGKPIVPLATPPMAAKPVAATSGSGGAPSVAGEGAAGVAETTPAVGQLADSVAGPPASVIKPAPVSSNSISTKVAPLQVSDNPILPPATAKAPADRPSSLPVASTPMTKPAMAATGQPPAPPLAKGSPEEKLKAVGLTRSGAYFVLASSEEEVLKRFQKIQPLINQMAQAFGEYAVVVGNEMNLRFAEEVRTNLTTQIDSANTDLSNIPSGPKATSLQNQQHQAVKDVRDGLASERDEADRTIEVLRRQQASAGRKEELTKDFASKRSDFLKAVDELRPIYDKASGEYKRLKSDPSVKDALVAYQRSTKAAVFPGPSPDFQKAIEKIKQAERAYAPEMAAPKKKGRTAKR